jgi:hypothetical protein
VQASLAFSNNILRVFNPQVQRGTRVASASGLEVQFSRELLFLTNGFSTIEPMVIGNIIGKTIAHVIEPYQFGQPPVAHVYGTIPLRNEEDADLHFELAGGPFRWWKFDLPYVKASIHWSGDYLSLTNVQADFYDGKAAGGRAFISFPNRMPNLSFRFRPLTPCWKN